MRSYVSVRTKELCDSNVEVEGAILLNIYLERDETLCPLTHTNCVFRYLVRSSYIEIVKCLESAVLVDRRAFLVQMNKISYKENSLATQGTDKVTAKITYVLSVKIVTDEPIKLPNFYR